MVVPFYISYNLLLSHYLQHNAKERIEDTTCKAKENKKSMKGITCTCGKTLTDEHGRAFRDVEQDINLPMSRLMLRCPECKKVTVVNWKEFSNE